jgi:hypothetical protein
MAKRFPHTIEFLEMAEGSELQVARYGQRDDLGIPELT